GRGRFMIADEQDLPLAVELRPPPDVESALVAFAGQPHCLLLDSAVRDPRLGRYSFLTANPFDFFTVAADEAGGLERLEARRATERIAQLQQWLSTTPSAVKAKAREQRLAANELAPQFNVPGPAGLMSNFSAAGYRAAIERAIEYIRAGDVFQVNLAQRLLYP